MKRIILFAVVMVLCATPALAQVSGGHLYSAGLSGVALLVTPGTTDFTGLVLGSTYSAVPDGAGSAVLSPINFGEAVAVVPSNILGDLGALVLVSFTLPANLQGVVSGRTVGIGFNALSAAWGSTGAETNFFDPHSPVTVILDGGGSCDIVLGGVVTVPNNADPTDTYTGQVVVTASYTGL
jgi:hypothetical protein